MVIIHSTRCLDYESSGHPERPARIRSALQCLRDGPHTWLEPAPCTDADLLLVHEPSQLEAVRTGRYHDSDTPFFPHIDQLARLAAGGAVLAAETALAGQPAFSLMRPPGHHATKNRVMGFCYYNNIAVAVARVLRQTARPVAILDFDCHHGNGTEDIFQGDHFVTYASLHQSPCYPGTGLWMRHNCWNYPLLPGTMPDEFLTALDDCLEKLHHIGPSLLAISAGFDSYRNDPITEMNLDVETFGVVGEKIRQFCQRAAKPDGTPLPSFAVMEGGYAENVGECVRAFIEGWEGRKA
jgi:acetoin utilization deacetylase AcuC-like enzyme